MSVPLPSTIEPAYRERTPRSRELWERALGVFPLGVSANLKYFAPYPVSLERALGSRLWDVDGHEYIDLTSGAGPHLLGHRHSHVMEAVSEQLSRLVQHLVPDEQELLLAERLRQRYRQLERLRFANTGSEATRMAIRVARSATGRRRVAKVEGHYHGSDDVVLVSSKTRKVAGSASHPRPVADAPGLSPAILDEVVLLPLNDAAGATRILQEHGRDIACVLLEPIGYSSGGAIATDPAFARTLRDLTRELGIVLIYDEVVTAHRLGPGGAPRWLGVEPDLTALGKAIGGGFPLAAMGGRADLMELTLGREAASRDALVFASGTFTANPIATSAGLAVLDVLDHDDPAARLDMLAGQLRVGLNATFARCGLGATAIGAASITQIHFAPNAPQSRREAIAADGPAVALFLLGLVARGIFWTPVHSALICAAHDEAEIDEVVAVAGRVAEQFADAAPRAVPA